MNEFKNLCNQVVSICQICNILTKVRSSIFTNHNTFFFILFYSGVMKNHEKCETVMECPKNYLKDKESTKQKSGKSTKAAIVRFCEV